MKGIGEKPFGEAAGAAANKVLVRGAELIDAGELAMAGGAFAAGFFGALGVRSLTNR